MLFTKSGLKKALIIVAVAALSFAVTGCGKKKDVDIRYGGQYYPGEFLLKGKDFWSGQGLTVEHILFSSGTENNEALISGNIDVNVGSDSKSVALFNALGDKALIIGTVQRGDRYSTMVPADSDYKDWADLKGKKVGTRFGSGAEFVLRKYFDSRDDLSWDDFQWVNLKTEDMIAALDSGQIASFTVWAPTGEVAESQGIARVLRSFGDVALTPVSIHTTKKFADENRELLVRFLAVQIKKARLIKKNPKKAAEFAAKAATKKGMKIDVKAFELIFEKINFQVGFEPSLMDELKSTAEFLKSQGKIKQVPEFYYDTSLYEEALKLVENDK
jgi:ABC-type nitrate/sulfonate/bicarbonate transport system substrate-binding protein